MLTKMIVMSGMLACPLAAQAQSPLKQDGAGTSVQPLGSDSGDIVVAAQRVGTLASPTPAAVFAVDGDALLAASVTNAIALGYPRTFGARPGVRF